MLKKLVENYQAVFPSNSHRGFRTVSFLVSNPKFTSIKKVCTPRSTCNRVCVNTICHWPNYCTSFLLDFVSLCGSRWL